MQLAELIEKLQGVWLTKEIQSAVDVHYVGAADLMSDILALTSHPMLLITGLTAIQTVRTAEMSGHIQAIVFVRGKNADINTIRLAEENEIPLITTRLTMYECCGILYQAGILPVPLKQHHDTSL